MNSIVCMDNTILKIVQIFVFVPQLLLMKINSACVLQGVVPQDTERARARALASTATFALVCFARARRSTSLMIIWLLNFLCLGANPRNGIANAADKQAG